MVCFKFQPNIRFERRHHFGTKQNFGFRYFRIVVAARVTNGRLLLVGQGSGFAACLGILSTKTFHCQFDCAFWGFV